MTFTWQRYANQAKVSGRTMELLVGTQPDLEPELAIQTAWRLARLRAWLDARGLPVSLDNVDVAGALLTAWKP